LALLLGAAPGARAADDGVWTVSKSSGEAWVVSTDPQPVSLKQEESLKPGDTIRTGRNGRVLLTRGEETILISPNSVIGVPKEKKDGLATTIVQQAGSILLEVEKKNVKHFEVETPYLAAVVKGTHFSVTVGATSTSVHVDRGQVEVADFRTGQIAQVMPGQAATTFANGKPGLSLSGTGTFNPIEQGKPRATSVERVPVPKSGLTVPKGGLIHALGQSGTTRVGSASHGPRISAAIGDVKLNVHTVTHGLAHSAVVGSANNASNKDKDNTSVWSDAKASMGGAPGLNQGNGSSGGNGGSGGSGGSGGAAGAASGGGSGVASTVATVTGAAVQGSNGNGNSAANGNGNNGNANGSGNGNSTTANNGNGNNGNGNGNGNGGVGNGNGNGNAKH
jgi:hypothetical protein